MIREMIEHMTTDGKNAAEILFGLVTAPDVEHGAICMEPHDTSMVIHVPLAHNDERVIMAISVAIEDFPAFIEDFSRCVEDANTDRALFVDFTRPMGATPMES